MTYKKGLNSYKFLSIKHNANEPTAVGRNQTGADLTANEREFPRMKKIAFISVDSRF